MKIHLLGPSCSGTTSLGKLIAEKYHIPFFDTDDIFWIKTDPPFTTKREIDERIQILRELFSKNDSFVLSGSAIKWGDFMKEYLDIIILKYVDQENRIKRLMAREAKRYGDRINPGNDMYESGGMEMRSRTSELAWIRDAKCKIIKLENNDPLEKELRIVSEEIDNYLRGKNV
jgi:uridine kinase